MRRWLAEHRGHMVEGTLTISQMVLAALALVGFASTSAHPVALWRAGP